MVNTGVQTDNNLSNEGGSATIIQNDQSNWVDKLAALTLHKRQLDYADKMERQKQRDAEEKDAHNLKLPTGLLPSTQLFFQKKVNDLYDYTEKNANKLNNKDVRTYINQEKNNILHLGDLSVQMNKDLNDRVKPDHIVVGDGQQHLNPTGYEPLMKAQVAGDDAAIGAAFSDISNHIQGTSSIEKLKDISKEVKNYETVLRAHAKANGNFVKRTNSDGSSYMEENWKIPLDEVKALVGLDLHNKNKFIQISDNFNELPQAEKDKWDGDPSKWWTGTVAPFLEAAHKKSDEKATPEDKKKFKSGFGQHYDENTHVLTTAVKNNYYTDNYDSDGSIKTLEPLKLKQDFKVLRQAAKDNPSDPDTQKALYDFLALHGKNADKRYVDKNGKPVSIPSEKGMIDIQNKNISPFIDYTSEFDGQKFVLGTIKANSSDKNGLSREVTFSKVIPYQGNNAATVEGLLGNNAFESSSEAHNSSNGQIKKAAVSSEKSGAAKTPQKKKSSASNYGL